MEEKSFIEIQLQKYNNIIDLYAKSQSNPLLSNQLSNDIKNNIKYIINERNQLLKILEEM